MQQKILSFKVDDQFIRAPHYKVVSDSKNYLAARFSFSEQWQGLTKTAVFQRMDGKAYHMLLEDDACAIPAEVITPTRFVVSVFGGDRLTTDRVAVEVESSGCVDGITPPAPTPDIYTQLVDKVETERQIAEAAAVTAGEKAEQSQTAAVLASVAVDDAAARANEASFYAQQAQEACVQAQDGARAAQAAQERAESFALSAEIDAQTVNVNAEQTMMARDEAVSAAEKATEKADSIAATDQNYNPTSTNPQSGVAVAEALNAKTPLKEWELLDDVELTEVTAAYSLSFSDRNFKEVYFEGKVQAADTTTEKQFFNIRVAADNGVWQGSSSFGAAEQWVSGHMCLSPSGTYVCDATVSRYGYTLDTDSSSFRTTGRFGTISFTDKTRIPGIYLTVTGQFAAGTTFKVWGR